MNRLRSMRPARDMAKRAVDRFASFTHARAAPDAIGTVAQAVALNPLFLLYRYVLGIRLLHRRAFEAAASQALQDLDLDSHFSLATMNLVRAYSGMGRHDDAIAAMGSVVNASHGGGRPIDIGILSWSYVAVGRCADAERFVGRLEEERQARQVPGTTMAFATRDATCSRPR